MFIFLSLCNLPHSTKMSCNHKLPGWMEYHTENVKLYVTLCNMVSSNVNSDPMQTVNCIIMVGVQGLQI